MSRWILFFLFLTVLAAILSLAGVGAASGIAQLMFVIFLVLVAASVVFRRDPTVAD